MDRKRSAFLTYARYLQSRASEQQGCAFCDPGSENVKIVSEHTHFYIAANGFPYTNWELRKVLDHLMIIPRRHVPSLAELQPDESAELASLLGQYEKSGYDIFARTPTSTTRTLVHQHTHLIKADGHRARGVLFWRKPYILKLFR